MYFLMTKNHRKKRKEKRTLIPLNKLFNNLKNKNKKKKKQIKKTNINAKNARHVFNLKQKCLPILNKRVTLQWNNDLYVKINFILD